MLQKLLFTIELSPHPCLTIIDHIQLSRINKSFIVLLSEVPVPHPLPTHTHTHTHTHTPTRLKILNVKFQKQFIFCTILNCMMNHPTLFCPGCKSFLCPAYPTHQSLISISVISLINQQLWYHSVCIQVAFILLNNGTKAQE